MKKFAFAMAVIVMLGGLLLLLPFVVQRCKGVSHAT